MKKNKRKNLRKLVKSSEQVKKKKVEHILANLEDNIDENGHISVLVLVQNLFFSTGKNYEPSTYVSVHFLSTSSLFTGALRCVVLIVCAALSSLPPTNNN